MQFKFKRISFAAVQRNGLQWRDTEAFAILPVRDDSGLDLANSYGNGDGKVQD